MKAGNDRRWQPRQAFFQTSIITMIRASDVQFRLNKKATDPSESVAESQV